VLHGGLLVAFPDDARAHADVLVPALAVGMLQVTAFFFAAALLLLERSERTLTALAVSPVTPACYLAVRMVTLTTLATAELVGVVWIAFGLTGTWPLIVASTMAMGVVYTGFGVLVASRYSSINRLLLPASMVVTVLLLPLLPHFGLAPRVPFLLHPIEPALTLIRAAYLPTTPTDLAFGVVGCVVWAAASFWWGQRAVRHMMRATSLEGAS
jgi:fluoroquinolone transport system permease protein